MTDSNHFEIWDVLTEVREGGLTTVDSGNFDFWGLPGSLDLPIVLTLGGVSPIPPPPPPTPGSAESFGPLWWVT